MIHYNSLYMCLPLQISERTFHFPLACLTKITPISIVHFSNNLFHSFEINYFILSNNQFHNDTLEFHSPWYFTIHSLHFIFTGLFHKKHISIVHLSNKLFLSFMFHNFEQSVSRWYIIISLSVVASSQFTSYVLLFAGLRHKNHINFSCSFLRYHISLFWK